MLAIAVVGVYWYFVLRIAGPTLVAVGAIALAGVFLWQYCIALGRTMLPDLCGGDDAQLIVPLAAPPDGAEPAYTQYFFAQALADYKQVVMRSAQGDYAVARGKWCGDLVRWLITGSSACVERRTIDGVALVFTIPIGILVAAVLTVSGLGAAVIAVGFGLVHLGAVMLAIVISGVGAGAFRAFEAGGQLIRRIRLSCPHPGCYRSIALPVYECPGARCGRRHRHLQPGRYGVFVRTCVCHERLPTLLRQGRHGLAAYCPHCDRPLPDNIGTTRAMHIPVVGGPSAGKTMLIMSAIVVLAEEAAAGGLELTFASDADRAEFERAREQLRRQGDLAKTVVRPPRAFLVYIGSGATRRLVYLYDAAGESTQTTEAAQQLLYLEHAQGLLFVVDPFAIAGLRASLDVAGQRIAAASKPSPEDPETTLTRISNVIRSMSEGGASALAIAVAVTKGDALAALPGLSCPPVGASGEFVLEWLSSVGLGAVNRNLDVMFGDVHYSLVSARVAVRANAGVSGVTDPLRWLLSRAGLDLSRKPEVPV
ncbi:MAG: hypothetical protein QOJ63_2450 [Solirubrobacteraceae bacterium]|nr:hypothetical protein [Solirubrobacteraceae bacterium]